MAGKDYVERLDPAKTIRLHSYEECARRQTGLRGEFHGHRDREQPDGTAQRRWSRPSATATWWSTPPNTTLTTEELDRSFDLPYERAPHPRYRGKGDIPAWEMIKHSVNIHRGCFGGCSFCTISAHQGKFIHSRSGALDPRRGAADRGDARFPGLPLRHRRPFGQHVPHGRPRPHDSAPQVPPPVVPAPDASAQIWTTTTGLCSALYAKIRAVKGIKKAFIGSGIRYDLFDESALTCATVVAPPHVGTARRSPPNTPRSAVLEADAQTARSHFSSNLTPISSISAAATGLPYQLIPYFISSHPGCTERDMRSLSAKVLGRLHFNLEQVQDLTPTPMTLSSVMFYTGENPYTHEKVYVARSQEEKRRQKAYFFDERPAGKAEGPDRKGSKGVRAKASRPQGARPGDKAGAGKKATREHRAKTTSSKEERPGGSRTTRPIPGMRCKR